MPSARRPLRSRRSVTSSGSPPAIAKHPRHPVLKLPRTERLPQVALSGLLEAWRQVLIAHGGRQQQDGNVGRLRAVAQNLDDVEPRPLGHDHVEHARVRTMAKRQAQRLLAVAGPNRLVPRLLQRQADELQDVVVVVGNEDHMRLAHSMASSRSSRARRAGSSTRKVAPAPGSLSTETRPSCASTMAFTIVSPRPMPGTAEAVAPGAR